MRIGITFDLKATGPVDPLLPDDHQEEFDRPETIEAIAEVLRTLGHDVVLLGDGREFLEKILKSPVDLVFNFAEGTGVSRSREARVPAVLEMLGIPYTGSDPLTMAATLDKDIGKKIVAAAGVAVPWSFAFEATMDLADVPMKELRFPLVAKPAWEGSSKGIRDKCLVRNAGELPEVLASLRHDMRQTILLEEYIHGTELTVGVVGNNPGAIVGIMAVIPKVVTGEFIYSLEMKRDYKQTVTYECPARLPQATLMAVQQATHTALRALGCRDVARADFRVRDGVPYFLEVNPLPGLNPEDSDLVIMARMMGWTYPQLIEAIVRAARERVGA